MRGTDAWDRKFTHSVFRVGVTEAHKSRWYAPKALFAELLVEDYRIRKYVDKRLNRTPPVRRGVGHPHRADALKN